MQKNPNHIDRPFDSNVIISEIIKSATLILLSKVGLLGRTFDRSRFWKYYFCKLPIEFIYTLCTIHYVFFCLVDKYNVNCIVCSNGTSVCSTFLVHWILHNTVLQSSMAYSTAFFHYLTRWGQMPLTLYRCNQSHWLTSNRSAWSHN